MQLYFNALYKGNFAQHMASFIVLVIPHTVNIKSVPPQKNECSLIVLGDPYRRVI